MKRLIFILLLLPVVLFGQTRSLGYVVGNQTVINVPIGAPGYANAQALIYYPDDYFQAKNAAKNYPLYVFLHGAGEGVGSTIDIVTNTSLPYLIKNGLKPYGIDPQTGDTVKFIVVSPFCANCNGSFSYPQLQYTIPYLFRAYRVDTSCVWVGGLSAGARGTWSVVMGAKVGDTALGKRITGIMPMANGGYDDFLSTLGPNLDTIARRGLATLYVIGDQDPGYNNIGFFAYQAVMKKYSQPGRYFDSVRIGGTHSTNVWNLPFPLTARVWSKTMNAWTQMWSLRKGVTSTPPPPLFPKVVARLFVDSIVIHYPTTWFTLTDSSVNSLGGSWDFWNGPNKPIMTSNGLKSMTYSGLLPGTYTVGISVSGDGNTPTNMWNADSARVSVVVVGPPAPRKVISIQVPVFGVMINVPVDAAKIGYDDGNTN